MSEALMNDKRLTVGEVCEVARCCKMTVYRAVREEKLPALRMGRKILVLGSDLEKYLRRGSDMEANGDGRGYLREETP